MSQGSGIEWTDATWNPTVGCSKVSPGCKHCYAETMHARLTEMGREKYTEGFEVVRPWRAHLELPLSWKKRRMIFVNSMSDLFHDGVPFDYIQEVFDVMKRAKQHIFQVLTKRSERLAEVADDLPWPQNIWMGVSVEAPEYVGRVEDLVSVPAAVRFLSVEPLLAAIPKLPLEDIHWVIVGGESGPKARPMEKAWVRQIRAQCRKHKVPFFFKQWGGRNKKAAGRTLDNRTYDEYPEILDPEPTEPVLAFG